jgi:hypothetical protein
VIALAGCQSGGCQPGIREDRTIAIAPDGTAAFQHGRNGVFVADPATGEPRRIYEPEPGDLAWSPPIWDAPGKRMVFAVARSADGARHDPGDSPANGRLYAPVPVRYTCWLYEPASGRRERLFESAAGHAGYVAAGLAVAWHPDGQGLDYVERIGGDRHRVFAFGLTTRRSHALPFPPAENVVLGDSHSRPRRFALLGGAGRDSGLWIDDPAKGWWPVPESVPERADLAELRMRLPRWSRDGRKLAFLDGTSLRVCDTETRSTSRWLEFEPSRPSPIFPGSPSPDLHWHPDGRRIGLITGSHSRVGMRAAGGWPTSLPERRPTRPG